MPALLNKDFLSLVGVEIDDITYDLLSDHYEHTLNERVMGEVVNYLDETQLTELDSIKNADDETLRNWLVVNVPELDEIIEDEVAILLGDLAEHADRL